MVCKDLRQLSLLAVLLINAGAANAAVDISGFASVGAMASDTDATFLSGSDVIGESASFGADNTLGLQVSADVNKQTSVAAQLLAKGTVDSYSIAAQWAYISYELSDKVSARMGRLNFPATLFSEYQEIGFSYPWVRAPMEVYTVLPLATYSGLDLVYSFDSGQINWLIQPFIGSSPGIKAVGGSGEATLAYGATLTANLDNGKLSFTATQAEGVEFIFSTGGADLSLNIDMTFLSAGIEYEQNNVVLIAELVNKNIHNNPQGDIRTISDMMAGYITLGYRVGDFLPHFTFSDTRSDHQSAFFPAGSALPSPPPTGVPAAFWLAPQDMIIPGNGELILQKSYTLGLRYDFSSQAALKVDYQKIIPDDNSWGVFFSDPGDEVNLLSFAVDVVF
jgi:hypothetical protein